MSAAVAVHDVGNGDLRALFREVEAAGWSVERGGGGHYKIRNADGQIVASSPATPSDYRSIRNVRAQLRRAGMVPVERERREIVRPDLEALDRQLQEESAAAAVPVDTVVPGVGEEVDVVVERREQRLPDLADLDLSPGKKIAELFRRVPHLELSPREVSVRTGVTYENASKALQRLAKTRPDLVTKVRRGAYRATAGSGEDALARARAQHQERLEQIRARTAAAATEHPEGTPAPVIDLATDSTEGTLTRAGAGLRSRTWAAVATDRHGRVVLRDANGDIWLASRVNDDLVLP